MLNTTVYEFKMALGLFYTSPTSQAEITLQNISCPTLYAESSFFLIAYLSSDSSVSNFTITFAAWFHSHIISQAEDLKILGSACRDHLANKCKC